MIVVVFVLVYGVGGVCVVVVAVVVDLAEVVAVGVVVVGMALHLEDQTTESGSQVDY